jgi:hypothetical protein
MCMSVAPMPRALWRGIVVDIRSLVGHALEPSLYTTLLPMMHPSGASFERA